MMIYRTLRLGILISLVIVTMCIMFLSIGKSNPTQFMISTSYLLTSETHLVTVFDMYRHLSVMIFVPDEQAHKVVLSPNGRYAIVAYGTVATDSITVLLWDIFSGELIQSDIPNCDLLRGYPEWLPDSRFIVFNCMGDIRPTFYFFELETRQLTLAPILAGIPSPDSTYMAIKEDTQLVITDMDGQNRRVIAPIQKSTGYSITWGDESDFILIHGANQLKRYTFATDSLDVLLESTIYIGSSLLSPDSQWLVFNEGADSNTYTLHLPTMTQYNVSFPDKDGKLYSASMLGMFWSPDSQWLVMNTYRLQDKELLPVQYIAKQDGSVIYSLNEGTAFSGATPIPPIWSSDNQSFAFISLPYSHLHVWCWDESKGQYNQFKVIENATYNPKWSPDNGELYFIDGYFQQNRLAYIDMDTGEIHFMSSASEVVNDYRLVEEK